MFTTSSQFEPNKGYSPYAVYTLLEHNGNYSESAKQLIKDGFGDAAKSIEKKILNKVNRSLGAGYSKEKVIEQLMVENSLAKNVAEQTIEDIIIPNPKPKTPMIMTKKGNNKTFQSSTLFIPFNKK